MTTVALAQSVEIERLVLGLGLFTLHSPSARKGAVAPRGTRLVLSCQMAGRMIHRVSGASSCPAPREANRQRGFGARATPGCLRGRAYA
jgi:hypothetical protein